MKLILIYFLALTAAAQDVPDALHVTAELLLKPTTKAMFGQLPKAYGAASVGICNDTDTTQTVPLMRVAQQIRIVNGPTLLPKDVAIAVIAAAQGKSFWNTALRVSVAAVSLAAIAGGWSGLNTTWKGILTDGSLTGNQLIAVIGSAIPTHVLLSLSQESLPDPLQLSPRGCVSGIVLVENVGSTIRTNTTVSLPATQKGQAQ